MRMNAVVNTALPDRIPKEIESTRIAPLQMRFREAVSSLLPQVRSKSWATVMPDNGAGMIDDLFVGNQQAPAEIDVIAGSAMFDIKQSNGFEGILSERHVTARNMFGTLVVDQNTGWISRRFIDALCSKSILQR